MSDMDRIEITLKETGRKILQVERIQSLIMDANARLEEENRKLREENNRIGLWHRLFNKPALKDEGSQSPVPGQGSAGAGIDSGEIRRAINTLGIATAMLEETSKNDHNEIGAKVVAGLGKASMAEVGEWWTSADRIVACVKALKGLNPGAVSGLVEAVEDKIRLGHEEGCTGPFEPPDECDCQRTQLENALAKIKEAQ